jgi:magnesium chelatase family protein
VTTNELGDVTLARERELALARRDSANDAAGRTLLTDAAERLRLSARGYHRVLRVARTLADLDGAEGVRRLHVAEALSYRRLGPAR